MRKESDIQDDIQSTEEQVRATLKKKLARRRIKRIVGWLVFLIIVAFAVYTYQFYKANGRLPFSNPSAGAAVVSTEPTEVTVQETVYSQVIDLSGYVEAYETQTVVFRSTGAVTGVYVKEGDKVKKGDLLATIDDTSQTYNLSNIESEIEQAKLEGSVRDVDLLEMQKTMALNNLEYTKVYANFDGVVASVSIEEGDYVEAGDDEVMILIDRSKLKATVEIDEIDVQNVVEGMTAELTFDSVTGRTIEATVSYIPMIGRYTSQGIGVMDVELTIENPPAGIAPGFTFAGTISVTAEQSMVVVSTSAITTSRGVSTVNKKGPDGNAVKVTVTAKYLGEGMSQILSGDIKAGDVLLLNTSSDTGSFGLNIGGAMGGGGAPEDRSRDQGR